MLRFARFGVARRLGGRTRRSCGAGSVGGAAKIVGTGAMRAVLDLAGRKLARSPSMIISIRNAIPRPIRILTSMVSAPNLFSVRAHSPSQPIVVFPPRRRPCRILHKTFRIQKAFPHRRAMVLLCLSTRQCADCLSGVSASERGVCADGVGQGGEAIARQAIQQIALDPGNEAAAVVDQRRVELHKARASAYLAIRVRA